MLYTGSKQPLNVLGDIIHDPADLSKLPNILFAKMLMFTVLILQSS